jgi:IS30 family transposase
MTDEIDIHKVLDFIRDNAKKYAQAKANRAYLENYRKTVKALEMKKHLNLPVSAQEREAYASDAMQQVDKDLQTAIEIETGLQWLLLGAQIKADAWRTLEANRRTEAKII